jgi:hypothetical protein
MSLLDEIQTNLIGPTPLSDVLRKASVLAYRLKNQELKEWAQSELNGYQGDTPLPEYRIAIVPSRGDFFNGAWMHRDQPMPTQVLPDDLYEQVRRLELRHSVRELESFIDTLDRSEKKQLHVGWSESAKLHVSSRLEGSYQCIDAWQVVTREVPLHALENIKNRLLALTLELADRYPEAAQVDFAGPVRNPSSEQVDQVVQYTIYGGQHSFSSGAQVQHSIEAPTMNEVTIGDGNSFEGDFVVAHAIEQSFNRVTSSELPDPVKDLLKQLTTAAGEMSKELPPESAQQVASDVETLTKEATSKAPRPQWLQLSGKGLVEAAKNVGAIGAPVIVLVEKLLPLLTG